MTGHVAYPAYKNSGIEWVGEVPDNWDVKPLFACTDTQCVKNDDGKEANVLSLSYGRIVRRDVDQNFGLLPESFNTYQLVGAGDIILRLTDLQNDKRSLRVGYALESGIITSAYLKLTAREGRYLDRYLYLLLHSYDTIKVFYGMGGGLRQSMKFDDMRRLPMLVPSLAEQEQIANFLDHETAKIDTLIDKQQQLIKLLKEKRQAMISHAVTKGLNPAAPMKDSGVEWLGEVPEGWSVTRLKYHTTLFEQGWSPQCDAKLAEGDEFGVLKVGCVNGGTFKATENKALPANLIPQIQYALKKNDLLISRANSRELVGSAAVVDQDFDRLLLCDKLYRLRFDQFIYPQFVSYYLLSPVVRQQIELEASGASHSMQNIGQGTIKELYIPVPPLAEAANILQRIGERIALFDKGLDKADQQILLLKERRTALISAAVTGKIDVRDCQPAG